MTTTQFNKTSSSNHSTPESPHHKHAPLCATADQRSQSNHARAADAYNKIGSMDNNTPEKPIHHPQKKSSVDIQSTSTENAKESIEVKDAPSDTLFTPPTLEITQQVMSQIKATIGSELPELGGMLAGYEDSNVITHYFFDAHADCNGAAYTPNIKHINQQLKEWNAEGIRLKGFVHSHPIGLTRPSWADEEYAARIMEHNIEHMHQFFMPIVQSTVKGRPFSFHPYVCVPNPDQSKHRYASPYQVLSTLLEVHDETDKQ